jgi:hypothetical protein
MMLLAAPYEKVFFWAGRTSLTIIPAQIGYVLGGILLRAFLLIAASELYLKLNHSEQAALAETAE